MQTQIPKEDVMSKYNMDSDNVLALRAMCNGEVHIASDDAVLRNMEGPWENTFPDISCVRERIDNHI